MHFLLTAPFRSILELDSPTDLPDLTVISGLNGSGKTHLLEAISAKAVEVWPSTDQGVAPLAPLPLYPYMDDTFLSEPATPETGDALRAMRDYMASVHAELLSGIYGALDDDSDFEEAFAGQGAISVAIVRKMVDAAGVPLRDFDVRDFAVFGPTFLKSANFRNPSSISRINDSASWALNFLPVTSLISRYHYRLNQNDIARYEYSRGVRDRDGLAEEVFAKKFGLPIEDRINTLLGDMQLPFRIEVTGDRSVDSISSTYTYEFKQLESGASLNLHHLSRGEQLLLGLLEGIFQDDSIDEAVSQWRPTSGIVLLDETDSALHPSRVVEFIEFLRTNLIKRLGLKVILTTHSPTTVALSGEGSVVELTSSSDGRVKIAHISCDEAVRSLLRGVEPLAVRMDYRRTIFVEGTSDEQFYSAISRLAAKAPYSLHFVRSGGERTGGKALVTELVNRLREAGNDQVFGIVDRDTSPIVTSGIATDKDVPWVFWSTERYSLENYILDPLLVGAALLRAEKITSIELGLESNAHHTDLASDGAASAVISAMVAMFGRKAAGERRLIPYAAGFSVLIPNYLLDHHGHRLADEWMRILGLKINAFGGSCEGLMGYIARQVVPEAPGLVPCSVTTLLASFTSHTP